MEDDITASVVLPRESLNDLDPEYPNPSVKLVANCERLLVPAARRRHPSRRRPAGRSGHRQRRELSFPTSSHSTRSRRARLVDHVAEFDQYTEPMKQLLKSFVDQPAGRLRGLFRASAHGQRSAVHESALFAAAARPGESARFVSGRNRRAPGARDPRRAPGLSAGERRAGGPQKQSRRIPSMALPPLAVYSPIHYQELPELFMDFICSLTGQIARDHRIRQRRRAHQRSVQRAVAGGGSEQRAGVGHSDRLRGIHHLGRLCRAELPRGSRRQPAGARDLVPHARARARSANS